MHEVKKSKAPFLQQVKAFPKNFWIANIMEMFERLAFFGVRAVLPLYLVASSDQLGIGLTYTEKGMIYMIWALIQCLLPMISGGYTDNYGYKKSLYVAFAINIAGYIVMAKAIGFWSMLFAAILIGTGTAIFKPSAHGTIAKTVTEDNSSVGFGLFYWVVNIGGALAPFLAANLRGSESAPTWSYVFYAAAIVTAINYIPAIFFFDEFEKDPNAIPKSATQTFIEALTTLKDKQFLIFLLIFSGFWFMFMQLWDLLPNFIDEWTNTKDVASIFSAILGSNTIMDSGHVKPEMIININPIAIILFVIPLSWLSGKFNPLIALIGGMVISIVGFIGSGATNIGFLCVIMIIVFTFGEMACSPKFSEYIGMTAPKDKKALYMGYSNIPFAIGWALGNGVSGPLYDKLASKYFFAREYLINNIGMDASLIMDEKQFPNTKIMETLVEKMGSGATLDSATQMLWNLHNPWIIWWILGSVGFVSTIAMVGFYIWSTKQKKITA
ncbi:MAG: MFS transporter [Pseudomonadota bacterium]